MAKKKKHRKKVKSHKKTQRSSGSDKQQSQKESKPTEQSAKASKVAEKATVVAKKAPKSSKDPADARGFDAQITSDVKLSLSLAAGIVAVFIVLWLILQYTSFGQHLHLLIKL